MIDNIKYLNLDLNYSKRQTDVITDKPIICVYDLVVDELKGIYDKNVRDESYEIDFKRRV